MLLATGLVFWLAHVYARLVGDRQRGARLDWVEMRLVGRREWPLVQAAIPPAAVAAVCAVIGLSDLAVVWSAFLAALAGQVIWAMIASAKANATTAVIVVSAVVNLVLGLIIVVLKVLIMH